MNRITELFSKEKDRPILNIYFTAGYPHLQDTMLILDALQGAGVNMVEIGMPFSDPLADGPVIQASSQQALANGISLEVLFNQLKSNQENIHIPIILMGYFNPVLQFGIKPFLKCCRESGVSGVILPDIPVDEFEEDYKDLFEEYGISFIFLVTPETSNERLKRIDALSSSFIYAVSSSSTTGKDKDWNKQELYLKRLKESHLSHPVLAGFGIKDKASFQAACKHTHGAIIGTAFIKALQKEGRMEEVIHNFISDILS